MYHAQPMWTQRTARRCLSYEACGRLHAGEQHHTAVHHRLCPNTRPSVVRSSKMRAILRRIQRARLWRNRCTGGRATLFAVCSRRCRQRGRLARKSWPFRGGMLVPAPPASAIPPLSVWPGGTPFGNTQEGPDRLRSAPITDPLSRGFRIPTRESTSATEQESEKTMERVY
jgi:hypothetical protein